ncbi:MAG: tryptophan synthase subunit alpha [Planctomycetota bacterium]
MTLATLDAAFAAQPRHVSPFLVLGDPTPELSIELAVAAVAHGATMLELGMPYRDPCADGPAIQAAGDRALAAGVSTDVALGVLACIHERCPTVPKNLLIYGNLVHARGPDRFCRDAAEAGAASLLAPDIPLDEGAGLRGACAAHGLGHVLLVAPTTPEPRLQQLDAAATGFLYLAAYQGVTGATAPGGSTRGAATQTTPVGHIAAQVQRPVCLGFGLSSATDLQRAFAAGARLCVVGSHLARAIGGAWRNGDGAADVPRAFLDAWCPLARVLTPESCPPEEG